jgi:hypothetical protein
MRYKFTAANGRTCCHTDDLSLLCARCRARAQNNVPPQPPDLLTAVRAARQSPAGAVASTQTILAPAPARHATRNTGVPEPPDVLDVMNQQRARGLR